MKGLTSAGADRHGPAVKLEKLGLIANMAF